MKMTFPPSRARGFTIAELVVAIAVIGILAAVIIASYRTIQASARDSKRVNDIAQLTKAMNAWVLRNDKAPDATGAGYDGTGRGWVYASGYATNIETILINERLLSGKTRDPSTPTGTGSYMFYNCPATSNPTYYAFLARVEKPETADGNEYDKWLAMGCSSYSNYEMNYARLIPYRG